MMQLEVKKSKRNALITKLIIIFLVIIALATYSAKSINNLLLPAVDTIDIKKGVLATNLRWDGTVDYAEKYFIFAKDKWCIEKILVKQNQVVKAGEKLAQVDMKDISLQKMRKELEISNIQNTINNLKKAEQPDNDAIKEKKSEFDIAKAEYLEIGDGLTTDGYILAQSDGLIDSISIVDGQTMQANEKVFEMARQEAGYCISWKVSNSDAMKLSIGSKVSFAIEDGGKVKNVSAEVNNKTFLSGDNTYLLSAKIDEEGIKGMPIQAGESITITYSVQSKDTYSLLPKVCILEDNMGGAKIYYVNQREGIFGMENYIDEVQVEIIGSDNSNYAIKEVSCINNVVLASSKSISKGIQVKLR